MIPSADKPPRARPFTYCSFCGKHDEEYRAVIAGPTVFICDECISLCVLVLSAADDTWNWFSKEIHDALESGQKQRQKKALDLTTNGGGDE